MTAPDADTAARQPELFQTARFHRDLAECWTERSDQPGEGRLSPAALERAERIRSDWASGSFADRCRWAFVLGLLVEASEPDDLTRAVRDAAIDLLPGLLDLVTEVGASDPALPAAGLPGPMYLLGQLSEQRDAIGAHCAHALPAASPWHAAAARIFSNALPGPLHRSVVAYLGAEAAGEIAPDRLPMVTETLACPQCQGHLEPQAAPRAALFCERCAHAFAFDGDLIDLRAPGSAPEAEFDDALVRRYESMTRPRFVRTMSRDWDRSLTPEVEERYIVQHLSTRDGPVLDLACGAGGWTEKVARHVGAERVLALDLSMPMVRACIERVPRAIGLCGDATRLPIHSNSLAGANCSDALQALPRPADALREIARCLRRGAPFTALTFIEGDPMYRYFQHRVPLHARHLFTEDGLGALLDDAGLEVTDWTRRGLAVFFTARRA